MIKNNSIIMLRGELGVGKTTLSGYILRKLLNNLEEFTSPTFNIVHTYYSALKQCYIHHIDLYRIKFYEELSDIGFYDILSNNIVLVEWPEIAFPILKKISSDRLMMIDLSFSSNDVRSVALTTPCNIY
jgi:tRNA threonylcarbamoyl adenosine modification protein YjeE